MDIYELLLANGPMHLDEIKKALMQEIEDKYKAEAKDLMRAQTKIADLKHELINAKLKAEPLSAELSQAREELEAMKASPARLFKGFIAALWNKAIHRERRAESDGQ